MGYGNRAGFIPWSPPPVGVSRTKLPSAPIGVEMYVEYPSGGTAPYGEIQPGECFMEKGRMLLKGGYKALSGDSICLNMETGVAFWFDDARSVTPMRMKVVPE